MDTLPSRAQAFNRQRITRRAHSLTVQVLPHILDKTMDNPESLGCRCPSLVLRESIQPLQDQFDVVIPEKLRYNFDCVAMSKVSYQRECTHSTVAAGILRSPKRVWRVAQP